MFGAHGSATPGHSRPHSRPLRLTNYAPKSQTNLPANFYPSNNNLIQALLVLLITNMISMGKTWSDLLKLCAASSSSSPLSNQMDPVVSLTYRSIFPPTPTETQLKCSPPHLYKYDSWLRILSRPHCTTLYCNTYLHCLQTSSSWQHAILYCTGQPQLS